MSSFGPPSLDSSGSHGSVFDDGEEQVYSPHAGGPRPRSVIRASDADREAAATELRRHFATGRLDTDELSERLSAAYAARTHGHLDRLFTDLPARPKVPQRSSATMRPPPRRARVRRRGLVVLVMLFGLFLAGLGGGADGHPHAAGIAVGLLLVLACGCCLLVRLMRWLVDCVNQAASQAGLRWGQHRSG